MLSLRKKLTNGKVALGMNFMYPTPGAIERVGGDWDWLWLDGQHGQFGYDSLLACVRAAERAGTPALVRVPGPEYGCIGLVADMCAAAIMVPMVDTPEDAVRAVRAVKFPPLGRRSFGGRRPIDFSGRGYAHQANEELLLVAQIETVKGLANVEQIAAVPGVDVVFFGPDDMSLQMGMRMDQKRPPDIFQAELVRIAAAAAAAGKICGTTSASPRQLRANVERGFQLCPVAGDFRLLAEGSKKTRAAADEALAK